MTRVRVRGIYATALTQLLRNAGLDVVAASPPIRARFPDADLGAAEPHADIRMTPDRQGVGITAHGDDHARAVRAVVADLPRDTFVWPDPVPRGAVFDAAVDHTVGGGAILDLGDDREAYLPFGAVDDHVTDGDTLRVAIRDPAPPWHDDRPRATATITVSGALASLDRGVDALVAGAATDRAELARATELLDPDIPDNWGVYWEYDGADASLDARGTALDTLAARADRLEATLADADGGDTPGLVAAPDTTLWAWFGRETRCALDDHRRTVAATMPGHHRIKAGSDAASDAVDFAEALGASVDEFPFGAVTDQFGPGVGASIEIQHGKPDGALISLGRGEVTDRSAENARITVEREMTGGGTYDALGVAREAGDTATTRFTEGNWWYPTVYRSEDGERKGTYLNVCTPVEVFPDAVRYVDLHVDVIKHADGAVEIVDREELQDCVADGLVSEELAENALSVAERVQSAVAE
ncbi:Rne/Rng family ribonuclease [Halobacterium salinarum]|uniref:Rne/Rng family ribonuclease n=2 Tax=Halobacterium salinarum TaxID=2242 RepID=UPI002555DDE7|nr:ribonuclease E/G [Halobacterium salinarum]MDL0132403.1 ribonuclease E/G [Halobacterium salinarum]